MASTAPAMHSHEDAAAGVDDYPYNGRIMLAAVISLSIVIFFVLLLHIYARWLLHRRRRRPVVRRVFREPLPLHLQSVAAAFPGHTAEIRLSVCGVDPKVVASLPVFVYKAREHEQGLECVVCLSAMEEEDSGRLLPKCNHAFHVGCIDMWLMSHATCPICRAPVKVDEPAVAAEGHAAAAANSVAVEGEEAVVQVEPTRIISNANEEVYSVINLAVEGEVVVEIAASSLGSAAAANYQIMKEDESSPSSSSSSSFSSSLKRMLSRGRS